MKPTPSSLHALTALILGTVALAGCGGPGIGLDAVTMPEADLAGELHPQVVRGAPFWESVAELSARQTADLGESAWEQFTLVRQILDRTDLTADDVLEVRLAARIVDGRVRPVTGFRLARPLTPEATKDVLQSLAEQYDSPVTITEPQHPGGTVLRVEMETAARAEPVLIGFAPGETVIFQGVEEEVLAAMDRLDSGRPAALPEELARVSSGVDLQVQAWLACTVSERQRGELVELFGMDGAPLPLQGLVDSLDAFSAAVVEFQAGESLEVSVHWYFEDAGKAESFHTAMDGLTELLKGLVALASGGRAIDAVESMTLTWSDRQVNLDLAISENDLLTLEELYELNLTE